MTIPRIEQINSEAEDAKIACIQAVLADRENNPAAFSQHLRETDSHIREMRRIFPELGVVSDDFRSP
jgi:ferritin-like metal-binding protein YciE